MIDTILTFLFGVAILAAVTAPIWWPRDPRKERTGGISDEFEQDSSGNWHRMSSGEIIVSAEHVREVKEFLEKEKMTANRAQRTRIPKN